MKTKLFLLCPILAFLLIACNNNRLPDNFDYGHMEGPLYKNSYFGMEMTVPAGWRVLNQKEVEEVRQKGKAIFSGKDTALRAELDAAKVKSAALLMTYQFELDGNYVYNPGIMLSAENLNILPNIKNGRDVLEANRKTLERSAVKFDYMDDDYAVIKVNGIPFYLMNSIANYNGVEIHQMFYAAVVKGFSLNVIMSYNTEAQKETLLRAFKSIKFTKQSHS